MKGVLERRIGAALKAAGQRIEQKREDGGEQSQHWHMYGAK